MKKLLLLILFLPILSFSQSKKELSDEIYRMKDNVSVLFTEIQNLKSENEKLKNEVSKLHSEISEVKNIKSIEPTPEQVPASVTDKITGEAGQCKAITAKGTQCSRKAETGSDFCWQHKNSGQAKSTVKSSSSSSGSSSGSSGSGRAIQTGSRGGKYYINKNGNKTYIKH